MTLERTLPHGVLVVDKPSGMTSHDVVAQARGVFGTRRVGHAGTLDPMATGVLVLLFGEATKLSELATREDKTYLAEVCFGRATDSHDADGRTSAERELQPGWLDPAALAGALDAERARREQVPPAVSAIKVEGRRSYQLARSGVALELGARTVEVRALELLGLEHERARFELRVSKGYYVRAFARDLGAALGVPAHLGGLRRVQSGCFRLEEACTWPPSPDAQVLPLAEVLPRVLPIQRLTPTGVERARQGKALSASDFVDPEGATLAGAAAPAGEPAAWTDAAGMPIALGRWDGERFRVQRGFATALPAATRSTPALFPPR